MIKVNLLGLCGLVGKRLSRSEASERLGISTSTFDRRVRKGLLSVERDATQLIAGKPLTYVSLVELGRHLGISDEQALLGRLNMLPPAPVSDLDARPAIALPYSDDGSGVSYPTTERVPDIAEPVPDDLDSILREAMARGCLVQHHPDLVGQSPESEVPRFQPIRFHQPARTQGKDPRRMGPQPRPAQSGYSNPVDSPEFNELWHGRNALVQRKP